MTRRPSNVDKIGRSKHFLFTLLLLTLVLGFCLFLIEFGFTRFYYSNVMQIEDKKFDPLLGWSYKPGVYWVKPPQSFRKHTVSINKHGIRNRELKEHPSDQRQRIVILGDSFCFGKLVPQEHLFSTRLEKELNRKFPNRYEVINTGVEGYGTAQEFLFMQQLARQKIIGDIYLLMIFSNDILGNMRLTNQASPNNLTVRPTQPGFELTQAGQIELRHLPQKIFLESLQKETRLKFLNVLKTKLESFIQTKSGLIKFLNRLNLDVKFPRMPGLIDGWYRQEILERGIPLMQGIIKAILKEAHYRQAKLYIGYIPSALMVYPDTYGPLLKKTFPQNRHVAAWLKDIAKPSRMIRNISAELNIPLLDLYPVMAQNNDKSLFIPREGHLNKNGHRLVAQSLARFVTRQEKGH